ncbi:hypothetical protein ACFLR2_02225 [Chlamydiota bacterium]
MAGSVSQKLKEWALLVYDSLHLEEIGFFFRFLGHRYSARQFSPIHVPHNLQALAALQPSEGLTSTREGKLLILPPGWRRRFFSLWNTLLGGALQSRVEKVVFYSYLTVTLELNNPFTKGVLLHFLEKKIAFLKRHLDHVKKVNGKFWDQSNIQVHIALFERNSLGQARVIENMHRAVKRQKEPEIIKEAKQALLKGLQPVLATTGLSGAYWMRGVNRQVLGLFKPFDEEIHAPHNPVSPRYRGALGLRKTRGGCRVGESAHHEVAAFLVDEFFGFGIVPKTYYAEFTHTTFFNARENPYSSRRVEKTKIGSFQEYVGGFVPVTQLNRTERGAIPLDEFQLLVVLDVIIGNTDRNIGNILFGDEKIAAIDHGLCFPDRIEDLSLWYWVYFEQGKQPLLQSIVDVLNHFPFEELAIKLSKRCFISPNALQKLRERVVLFTEAVNAGLVPAQIENLLTAPYLYPLRDLNTTLKAAAAEQVRLYQEALKSELE